MIGIYKIQNRNNGKVYIGQSNDCERRIKEHCYPSRYLEGLPIDIAIHKYGKENFTFDIIEECSLKQLNERKTYWILKYESNTQKGYNCNIGGDNAQIGEGNSNAKISEQDVIKIRQAYKDHKRKKETYELVKDKITFNSFEAIWEGKCWIHIMPEVYTEENKKYYSVGAGCISNAAYSDSEIMAFRKEYENKTAKEIYNQLKNPPVSFPSFQKMLNGTTYKHLPYYSKTYQKWFDPDHPAPKAYEKRGQHKKRTGLFTDEEIMTFRKLYVENTAKEIYEQLELKEKIAFDSFQKIMRGATYKHLPYYSKTQRKWIN